MALTEQINNVAKDVYINFNKDIGMFSINRSAKSCLYATDFCRKNCYNLKLYKAFGHVMKPADVKYETTWDILNGFLLDKVLSRKKLETKHVRFASRGETLMHINDIYKVAEIVSYNKNRKFLLPTRGWRNTDIKKACEEILFPIKNLYMLASIDPSNTDLEIGELKRDGWSTFFFGDDTKIKGKFKCPKTWNHVKGICPGCENGCFSDKRVDIHLKQH